MLHRAGKGLLVFVPTGLQVVDELEVDPSGDPVPVEVVDDDVLFHDAAVVAAPGQKGDVLAAPGAKGVHRVGEGESLRQTFFIKTGELFHLVVHTLEVGRLDIDREFLAQCHVVVQLDGADLDDLTAQMDRQLVEYGRFGAHGLVPLQIHHDIVHKKRSFLFSDELLYHTLSQIAPFFYTRCDFLCHALCAVL